MVKNDGVIQQYYIEGHHDPIVSADVFERVQREIERREKLPHRYTGGTIFSSKIICGECGCYYGPKVWHSNDRFRRVVWQCNGKYHHSTRCKTPHLTEDEIKEYFMKAVGSLWKDRKTYIEDIEILKDDVTKLDFIKEQMQTVKSEMEVLAEAVENVIYDNAEKAQNQDEYRKRYDILVNSYETKQTEYEELRNKLEASKVKADSIDEFIRELKTMKTPTEEFDMWLWGSMVESMTVGTDGSIIFEMKSGMRIRVQKE